jgi:hypothetical protein
MFVAEKLLTLVYADGRARQWDLITCELRRSLDRDKALGSAKAEGWQMVIPSVREPKRDTSGKSLPPAGLPTDDEGECPLKMSETSFEADLAALTLRPSSAPES